MNDRELAEWVASRFHYHYETNAYKHGYVTRESSAVPWESIPENNRALMVETVLYVLRDIAEKLESIGEPIDWEELQSAMGESPI
jgi:hypothetical protein